MHDERVFTNGRQAYIIRRSPTAAAFDVWFLNSMGSERWPRDALPDDQLEAQIAQWTKAGYREQVTADANVLNLNDKQFQYLHRAIGEWRRRHFDVWGEMSEPGDYTFDSMFEFRFGFRFEDWERTTHARGFDRHPPVRDDQLPDWEALERQDGEDEK